MRVLKWLSLLVGSLLLLSLVIAGIGLVWRVGEVRGEVTSNGKPLAGATVRIKTTEYETNTDTSGRFTLTGFPGHFSVRVTAWVDSYYIGGATVYPWTKDVDINLEPYNTTDNANYAWVPPSVSNRSFFQQILAKAGLPIAAKLSFDHIFMPLSAKLPLGCADCHGAVISQQYASNAHALGANNIIFQTVYNGTDGQGHQSPLTKYGFNIDYGTFPLPHDSNQPWYGPGFKLDFPDQAGNCANCHVPGAAIDAPNATDINKLPANTVQGTHCDFCHKVSNVKVNPVTKLPEENMTGVMSMEFNRPYGEPQIFFGPYDDVDVGPDTYSPLQNDSKLCASCHNASFWGTPVYQSYSEWLNSPYPAEGKTCQTCHMPVSTSTDNFAPGKGGLDRDQQQIFAHNFPGASDTSLLQNTAKLGLSATRNGDNIEVEVQVTNENAGHDMPTDQPMRNIILVIEARDSSGKRLEDVGNQKVPDWGGKGITINDYAGLPGKGYAKVLEELWTEVSPTIAYWQQTKIKEDTRIPARATDITHYKFQAPQGGDVTIEAKLIYRRAFKDLGEMKEWGLTDIEMEQESMVLQ